MLYEFYLNRKRNSNSDSVLVLGMRINHIVYRGGGELQDLIVHYEQKKEEIIRNGGKLVF
jgi:exopolysaccharide biosynthesis predicted pyruvyltransferase EpsI